MIYNSYGQTGIKLSAIGFGGMRFKDTKKVDACASLVKTAYDAGINLFDTAPGYGESEDMFGVAFKDMLKTREEKPFYVSTKSMKGNAKDVRKDLETSLKRMNLDYVDFLYVWCIKTLDVFRERGQKGAIREFERIKEEGLAKHICVSTHMPGEDVGTLLTEYPFEGVLLGYSAMNFAYRDAGLTAAKDLGRGVVVMNPLGGGLIPENPGRFAFVKTRDDETTVEGALRFLLNDPRVTVSLVGFSSEEEVREAVSAVDGFRPIPGETVERIRSELKNCFNELCTSCRYCENCPQGIPVSNCMEGYNFYHLDEEGKRMVNRMRWHWNIELENHHLDDCTECGACEEACTQNLPIIERLKTLKAEIEKVVDEEKKNKV